MHFCFIVYGLLSLSSKAFSLVVGRGSIYRLQHSCTVEHIPLASLPSEDIVATRPTGNLFQCAKDCETDERCGSFSLTESCTLLNAEENVCDTNTGIFRKVRSNYCENGGTFVDYSHCDCPPLWSGPFCDLVDVNECASNPCGSNGVCYNYVNYYTCSCLNGWSGTNCQYYAGSVLLTYGSYGILQVLYNNEWGTVCDDWFDTNNNGCQVVCRQLGYYYGVHVECGAGAGTIWMDDVQCTGAETNLYHCPHLAFGSHNCVHEEDVGCRCCNTNSICDNLLC